MNLIKRLKYWFGMQQIKTTEELRDLIKKSIQIEEQEECNHAVLRKLIKGTTWYQCSQCGMVMYIHGATGWHKSEIKKLTEKLSEELKFKFKKEKKIIKE
jgi:hypothetical protein